jgi:DNA-binding GntR family transcriptional regulator
MATRQRRTQTAGPIGKMRPVAPQVVNQHLTKSNFAYQELRRMILEGQLQPGERLLLRNLADELELSIQPIRDAIKMLERDGLVETESHRGAIVTQISGSTAVELISVRMWIEILAVEQAVPLHTPESIAAVEFALAESEEAVSGDGDGLSYSHANRRLHETIELPAPQVTRDLVSQAWDDMWRARRQMSLFTLETAAVPSAERDHARLAAAVKRQDVKAATAAMAAHRESTLKYWERAVKKLSRPAGSTATRS